MQHGAPDSRAAAPDALRWPSTTPNQASRPSLLVRAALPLQLTAPSAVRAPPWRATTRLRVAGAVGRRCVRCCRQPAAWPLRTQPEVMPPSCMPQRLELDAPPLRSQHAGAPSRRRRCRPRGPLCPSTCRAATPPAREESNTFPRRAKATSAARLPARHGRRVPAAGVAQLRSPNQEGAGEAGGGRCWTRAARRAAASQRGGRGAEAARACARDAHFARCTRCSAAQRMVAAARRTRACCRCRCVLAAHAHRPGVLVQRRAAGQPAQGSWRVRVAGRAGRRGPAAQQQRTAASDFQR
jgi:hypothetical protein